METREDLLDFLKSNRELLRSQFHVIKIGLFGSFARNEQTSQSDIDLIVELDSNVADVHELKNGIREYIYLPDVTGMSISPEKNIYAHMLAKRY